MTRDYSHGELLIAAMAGLLDGCRHVVVGTSSPMAGAAALLRREQTRGAMRVTILGSTRHNALTNGGVETFDLAAEGRVDVFFLGGGQIDGEGNVNLVGTGRDPATYVRWPGSFGSSYLYFLVPRVILFREEHSRRVMVPRVDFISSPGTSGPEVHRSGGPHGLLTGLCWFSFQPARRRFRLESVHPGHTIEEVRDSTGFEFECPAHVPVTAEPGPEVVSLVRGKIREEIAEVYPRFAATLARPSAS